MITKILTNKIALLILVISISFHAVSQTGKLIKADKNFKSFNYQNAIKHYLDLAKNGFVATSKEYVGSRLGDSYRLINDPVNAELWYRIAVDSEKCEAKTYYYYAQVLRNNKKYKEASVWMKNYLASDPEDKTAIKELAEFDDYSLLLADSNRISIEFMENINTNMSDYSPAYYKDKIVFVSSRDTISARRSAWTDEPFYSLYECKIDSNHKLVSYNRLFGEVNSRYHEGPVAYHKQSGILYFTRNNYYNKKKGKSKDNTNYLKIYQAIDKEGKWQDIKELAFNNDEYSCAHPAISPDGSRLYFISNMPGGFGGTDLYYCEKQDSAWSKPINAGEPLNTAGNELFPTYSHNGTFYFASTGHPGLGGIDIFSYSKGVIKNIGYPINSSFDDFGFATENDEKGFFSSNRNGGFNNDDIYYFKINQPPVAQNDELFVEIIDNDYTIDTLSINVIPNDTDPNKDIDFSSVKVISQSNKNSLSLVDSIGNVYYLPENGFKGVDTLKYVVFDQTSLSDTASLFVHVFGKTPPVATADSVIVHKNSENNRIAVLKNDYDKDGDLIPDSIEVITDPQHGTIEVLNGTAFYSPDKEFSGKDYLVYQIYDRGGLADKDTAFIDVKMLFMGQVVTDNFELNLTINFHTGRWDITPQAASILDSVITVLKENPSIEIELGAHTDSRGSAKSNQSLSQKRAESSIAYINSKGVEKKRLIATGYGESQLKNNCKDGVPCNKADHAVNRRVTIRITKF